MLTEHEIFKKAEKDCYKKYGYENFNLVNKCSAMFDGIMCWQSAEPGETVYQNCSNDYLKTQFNDLASKFCTENGTWYVKPNNVIGYTNYTLCGNMSTIQFLIQDLDPKMKDYEKWVPVIKCIAFVGCVLSIIALLIALAIFISIKRLHCQRNRLHIHLFISFLLRTSMVIIKDSLFVDGLALVHEYVNENPTYSWICKAIISIKNYFIMCNFMMVLMEGMYLHNLMFLNLFSDNNDVSVYYCLGWGVPLFLVLTWVLIKLTYDNAFCWTGFNRISLFIDVPIGITVVVNFILFMLIIRVLFLKLNTICIQRKKAKYGKLLKSTLILIPIFGFPYIITFVLRFWVHTSHHLELVWLLLDQSFGAFQGLFAALVYCFLNNEVQIEIKRKYMALKDRNHREFNRTRTISHTQQFSLPLNDDNLSENLKYLNVPEEISKIKARECHI